MAAQRKSLRAEGQREEEIAAEGGGGMGDKAALIGGDGTMRAREALAPWARRGRSQRTHSCSARARGHFHVKLTQILWQKSEGKNRSINQDVASNQFWGVLSRCAPHDGFECNLDSTCFENM